MSEPVNMKQIFDAEAVAASGSADSVEIALNAVLGYFALQLEITGDGTAKVEYLPTINGEFVQVFAIDNGTGLTKTTNTTGKTILPVLTSGVGPPTCIKIKVRATETGGVNGVTISGWMSWQ